MPWNFLSRLSARKDLRRPGACRWPRFVRPRLEPLEDRLTPSGNGIVEYTVPTAGSEPWGITTGPDNNLWIAEHSGDKVAKLTTSGVFTEYGINGSPQFLTAGPAGDGNVWITGTTTPTVYKVSQSGSVTAYDISPGNYSYGVGGITVGQDGNLWEDYVLTTGASKIGMLTPAGTATEHSVTAGFEGTEGIVAGPDGNLWFADYRNSRIGVYSITGGGATYYSTPTMNSGPEWIAAGADGNLWFTEENGNKIGRITTSGVITEFNIPTANSGPRGITAGPDGALWFTEYGGNKIGRITTAGVITEYSLASGSDPESITVGPDGHIWFTEPGTNKIGAFDPTMPPDLPATSAPQCGCTNVSADDVRTSSAATGHSVDESTVAPVRYGDGVVTIAETDLYSAGFGSPWAQTRSWTNGTGYAAGGDNGNGWVDSYTPHLLQADGSTSNTLVVVSNGTTARYYTLVNGAYQASFDDPSRLTYNSGNDTYTLVDSQGDQIVFTGFGAGRPVAQRGEFASDTNAAGVTMAVTSYTADGHIAETQRSSGGVTESFLYSYLPAGNANAGLLAGVTLRRNVNGGAWSVVRQAQYAYYDGTQQNGGALGDLMTATVLDANDDVLSTSYYRYNSANELSYVFNPASYLRLTSALGTNLGQLTDAQVAPYADNAFLYDDSGRVVQETVQGAGSSAAGGLGVYTLSYTTGPNAAGFNSWHVKTVVTNPDGSTDTVYTNAYDEVMLDDHYDPASGLHWDTFDEYNGQGQLILQAAPSAVTGYNDSYADLLNNTGGGYQYLSNTGGPITLYDYYTGTTATETAAGGVAGYTQDVKIEQGQQGTPVLQETWQYFAHAFDGQTVAPVATDTVYRNTDGTGAETTSFAYTWYSNTAEIQSETDSAPVASAAENGPGAADVTTTFFDALGRPVWVKDADGYIQYMAYDTATGAMTTSIVDVNTSDSGEFTGLPTGWVTPAGGGLNLVTTDQVDALGRTTEETSPAGNVTYWVYLDPQYEVRVYAGWDAATGLPTGPTEVIHHDPSGYDETFTMTATPHLTNGVPDGTEAISGLQTLSRAYENAAGQVTSEDDYFNLSGLVYSTSDMGAWGINFYQTRYAYDNDGRQYQTQTGNGTIYQTLFDSLGRPVSDWVGTTTANLVEVSAYQYDNGGVGDGNLTQETDYPGGGATARVTLNWYDWRDRLVASKSGVEASENDGTNRPIIVTTYDNLDEVVETQQYTGDGVTPQIANGVLQPLPANLLRAQEIDSYDEQGRVFQTQVFDVNPTTGAVSSTALTTNSYYDHRGDLIAVSAPGGLWSKSQFDGAGRDVMDYATDGAGGTSWSAAMTVANDTVLEQTQTVYDDSDVIETIDSQRFDNAVGTGPLGTPTSGVAARVYYAAAYYDNADRLTATVDVGTNGGVAWTRPGAPPTPSDTALVTGYVYDVAGWVQDVIDPLGIDTRSLYDALGRTTETIANYTGNPETAESDVATQYTYDGDNNVVTVMADEPGGAYQMTQYVYGVTTATGSAVNSNDILSTVMHPDPTTGNPSASQEDTYTVNALGQVTSMTDRNGNVHQYSYDVLGRLTSDAVTTLGAGVDGSVRRIDYAYDSQGNPYLITSYDSATGGNIVNQVLRQFDGLGQLTAEYQSHNGAVNVNTTPAVLYAYTEMAGGQNNSRLTSMTYPSGYVVNYNYGAGLDNSISRLTSLSDSGGVLESYKYLGLDTVVERDHPQNNVNLTYISQNGSTGDAGDQYTGLDRFGRVVEQNWYNASTHSSTDDFKYSYDRDSNVLSRTNVLDAIFSEGYTYDNLNQLTSFTRGSHTQSWTPDALGNFTQVTTDGTTQTRTANQQNEITSISGQGAVTYDANGNLTADGSGNTYVYDAWNRLVRVLNNGTTVASYAYNGQGERITETHGTTTTDLYLSAAGQVLEERVGGVAQTRYVWSPVYVNALVLRDQSGQRLYVQQDANWNVTALVDASGNVQERYLTDPYGAVIVLTATWGTRGSSAYGWIYFFQGGRYDAATGQYHFGYRDWSVALERFDEPDPLGLAPDNNDYRGEGDNPIDATDPSGLYRTLKHKKMADGTIRLYAYENLSPTVIEGQPWCPVCWIWQAPTTLWRLDMAGPDLYVGYINPSEGTTVRREDTPGGVDLSVVKANVGDVSIRDWRKWFQDHVNNPATPFRLPDSAADIASRPRSGNLDRMQDQALGGLTPRDLHPGCGTSMQAGMQGAINAGAQAAHDSMRGHLILAGGISAAGLVGGFFAVDVIPNQSMVRVGQRMTQAEATEALRGTNTMTLLVCRMHLCVSGQPCMPREVLSWPSLWSPMNSGGSCNPCCRPPSRAASAIRAANPWGIAKP